MKRFTRLCLPILLALLGGPRTDAAATRPPNVVIILADDLGYGDLGAYGAPNMRTPHLDRLATEGQKWTNFYSQSPVCSPSRAALLTGRLPVRNGMFGSPVARAALALPSNAANGLPLSEITLAELLKPRGYATAMIGKWHLGQQPRFLPTRQGFDLFFGIPFSHDMRMTVPRDKGYATEAYYQPRPSYWDVPLYRGEAVVERPLDHTTITRRLTDEAVAFIRVNRRRPFLLYLAHPMPHIPLGRSPAFVGRTGSAYAEVVEELDDSVGRVVAALAAGGISGNTLVVFTSDNGPWLPYGAHAGSAGPFQNGKGTTWEGAMRVPAIFWWPQRIRPGVVTGLGSGMDIFSTALSLARVPLPRDRVIDGLDLTPALTEGRPSPRREMLFYWDDELRALRRDRWKAHFVTSGAWGEGPPRSEHEPPLLFDLIEDPGERRNLAARHPAVAAELLALARRRRDEIPRAAPLFDATLAE